MDAVLLCHSLEEHTSSGTNTSLTFLSTQHHGLCCRQYDQYDGAVDLVAAWPAARGYHSSDYPSLHSSPLFINGEGQKTARSVSTLQSKEGSPRSPLTSGKHSLQIAIPSTSLRSPRRRCFSAEATVNPSKSPSSPDRFIPGRESIDSSTVSFRVSKSPQQLSPEEKLLRQRDTTANPFRLQPLRRAFSVPRQNRLRHQSPHFPPHLVNEPAILRNDDDRRRVSAGGVWNVGGPSAATSGPLGIPDGMGSLLGSGTTAPMYVANFQQKITPDEERKMHESRLALALDIDLARRQLSICKVPSGLSSRPSPSSPLYERYCPLIWKDNAWKRSEGTERLKTGCSTAHSPFPRTPFRVLDAPLLRDDFYCSTLAYSYTSKHLAVGLSSNVYLWSEAHGVQCPPFRQEPTSNYVTSLSFSSKQGGRSILAVGRQGGQVCLWSTFDRTVRFEFRQPSPVSCLAFKQATSRRQSERFPDYEADMEDLAIGDDAGQVWYYSVEWPDNLSRISNNWNGSMTLLAKISAHTQQICGFAWSPDGAYLATGGNDNCCLLFDLGEIFVPDRTRTAARKSPLMSSRLLSGLQPRVLSRRAVHVRLSRLFDRHPRLIQWIPFWAPEQIRNLSGFVTSHTGVVIAGDGRTVHVPSNSHRYRFVHSAAVKAIAFAPWLPSLLATGGGSNDRSIHFFHAPSGTCLATIDVQAQVTSLIWSKTRREIAATFGYAQPEHPYRIAVFAWPSCRQIIAIPWNIYIDEEWSNVGHSGRALWAVSYPGGPNVFGSASFAREETEEDLDVLSVDGSTTTGVSDEASVVSNLDDAPRTVVDARDEQGRDEREGRTWWRRTADEGCLIIASSDGSIRFHEVWRGSGKNAVRLCGLLGGSDILEGLEGIETDGREIIR
ncbi:hypothetical protein Egran_03125 [Elaphomyces granulatus]|uniref:Uncharacterized protein n=1 Tax=Elaphomyces granulatus TaxID=519963 RepID=A0A232LYF7_9EURO|nr:hypothetical protein Egran_03125 [Elaphomyces granulatus]